VWSYHDSATRGVGPSTASQTSWAILGLLAAGDTRSDSVHRGVAYLLATQNRDGSWWEKPYTGTGFPKVFYLKYHAYAQYFPLLALAAYRKAMAAAEETASIRPAENRDM
jgi:squalene-hopene/tetraprenyl-beta-curcumene cyclase